MVHRILVLALLTTLPTTAVAANGITVAKHANPAPDDIAAPVKAVLAPGGATVTAGDTTIDFWWVTSLDAAGAGWSAVPEGALVGAMKVSATLKDIRGRNIKPGTYLLRFALEPQNGDHLGVSPHREFLLVTPAAEDTAPAALGHDAAVELGTKTTNIAHPAVLSVDPPVATEPPLTVTQNADGHTAVVFEVPTTAGALRFGLILIGHIEA
ncbi:MAG: hypothetical protein ACRD26_20085 [Vicinamibacterales bacterium]